jgi:phosphoglycerate kinase
MTQSVGGHASVDGFTRLAEIEVERRPVFVRADLDAPVGADGTLLDDTKILAAVPTLRFLLEHEAQVVVGAHRSVSGARGVSASGARDPEPVATLEPYAARLAEVLETEVYLPDRSTGLLTRKLKNELRPGRLLVLENLLLDPREARQDVAFGHELAEGMEVYVGDCLAGPHTHTSLCMLPKFVRERALGLRLEQELVAANRLRHAFGHGLVLLLGGDFGQRSALLDHALLWPGACVVPVGNLRELLVRAERARPDPNDHDAVVLAQARSWLAKANSRGLGVELADDSEALTRTTERLSRARATLVVGRPSANAPRDAALLTSSVKGSGLLVAVHDESGLAGDLAQRPDRSRGVFISTAGDAFERLLCEQKLAGVEALRRAA